MKFALIERKDEFEVLESCRSEVWSYLCQGMTRQDIAIALKVDASTISRDIEHLTLKSQQYRYGEEDWNIYITLDCISTLV
jgi:DNA-binding NarL/FixJ family response regulator